MSKHNIRIHLGLLVDSNSRVRLYKERIVFVIETVQSRHFT